MEVRLRASVVFSGDVLVQLIVAAGQHLGQLNIVGSEGLGPRVFGGEWMLESVGLTVLDQVNVIRISLDASEELGASGCAGPAY